MAVTREALGNMGADFKAPNHPVITRRDHPSLGERRIVAAPGQFDTSVKDAAQAQPRPSRGWLRI